MKLIECPVSAEQAVATIKAHPSYSLDFARRSTAGRVHVLRPWRNDGMRSHPDELTCQGLWIPAGILGWSLCGQRLVLHSQIGYRVSTFKDDDLCWTCHELLGDQAVRCFEHDRPEEL